MLLVMRVFVGLIGMGTAARAMVAPTSLDELIERADAVVVGTVERVETVPRHNEMVPRYDHLAHVEVQQALKGTPGQKLVVHIYHTSSPCDITAAEPGERVMLFLGRSGVGPVGQEWVILHAGRGRQVIDKDDNMRFFSDVLLPEPLVPDARQRKWGGGVVPLSQVVKYIADRVDPLPSKGRK
jgi:hypothetical protein